MRQLLSQQAYRSVMCNVVSILNPKLRWANTEYKSSRMHTHHRMYKYPCIIIHCVIYLAGLVI